MEETEEDSQAKPERLKESSAGIWAQAEDWVWILKCDSNLFGHTHSFHAFLGHFIFTSSKYCGGQEQRRGCFNIWPFWCGTKWLSLRRPLKEVCKRKPLLDDLSQKLERKTSRAWAGGGEVVVCFHLLTIYIPHKNTALTAHGGGAGGAAARGHWLHSTLIIN